jgi:uncharacterized protein (DUF58 family)
MVLAGLALAALVLPWPLSMLGILIWTTLVALDAWSVRRKPAMEVHAPDRISRGRPARLEVEVAEPRPGAVVVVQGSVPGLRVRPRSAPTRLDGEVVGYRRGRYALTGPASRSEGPLGLGLWFHRCSSETSVEVYPDMVAARRLATLVRMGLMREASRALRGPLGLGTEFETIRDYQPDDDFRQINWAATQRSGRLMSNQYRVERDRDVVCLLDCGRLMSAPLGDETRLDAAVDAVTAVALVAQEVGDRCGVISFDREIRRELPPGRRRATEVVSAIFDATPAPVDSDYELVFRRAASGKRALVIVLTDLLDESAARSLVDATPILTRRHAVAAATVTDPGIQAALTEEPRDASDAYRMAVALDLDSARRRVSARLRRGGAMVVEAHPDSFSSRVVRTYLLAKARARF